MDKEANKRQMKLWAVGAMYPALIAVALTFGDRTVTALDVWLLAMFTSIAALGAAAVAFANYVDEPSLEEKLERLEDNDIMFRAGYYGIGETFTSVFPDGTFLDYAGWMRTGDNDKKVQWFHPSEFERVVDETLEYVEEYEKHEYLED